MNNFLTVSIIKKKLIAIGREDDNMFVRYIVFL